SHQIQVNAAGELDLIGSLAGGQDTDLFKEGTGKLVLSGDNSRYSGNIALDQGTIQLGSSDALTHVTFSHVMAGAVLDLNTFDATVSFDRTIDSVAGAIRLGTGTLSLDEFSLSPLPADIEGTISGPGGLTIVDQASVVLGPQGTFSYTGQTLVNAG